MRWPSTPRERFEARQRKQNAAAMTSQIMLVQDESHPLRKRCEHAMKLFEARGGMSLVLAIILGICICALAATSIWLLVTRARGAWILALIYLCISIPFLLVFPKLALNVYVARQIMLRIKRSLDTQPEELYLPSEGLIQGRYMLLLRPPWFCEVADDDGEDKAYKKGYIRRWVYHHGWAAPARDQEPMQCAVELNLIIAEDTNCAAQKRAEAAYLVFSEYFRSCLNQAALTGIICLSNSGVLTVFFLRSYHQGANLWLLLYILALPFCIGFGLLSSGSFAAAWVAYHIKSRIRDSLDLSAQFPVAAECHYCIPSDSLLRKGFKFTRNYPYYEELEEPS